MDLIMFLIYSTNYNKTGRHPKPLDLCLLRTDVAEHFSRSVGHEADQISTNYRGIY